MVAWARRNPGLALLALALAAAIALYAPSLSFHYVNSDDNWLIRDNALVQHPSWNHLRTILFDLDPAHRFSVGVEYLPVRDLSYTLDVAIWGDWLPGFHLTNLLLYLGAIALWFFVFDGFGIDRTVCGLAMLIWAVHPEHAESVSWLAERKGLLGVVFAGIAALGYVRFRTGRSAGWLVLAIFATALAVWSKAHAAFTIAALAPLQLLLPGGTRKRALLGLGLIGATCALAFAPVFLLMSRSEIVGAAPSGKIGLVLGVHGFYARLATMTLANAYSYPLQTFGPSAFDIAVGAIALAGVAIGLLPRWPAPVRAACALWLVGWFPVSHILLPLQMVIIADRYMMVASLGFALLVGYGLSRVPRWRPALVAIVALAAAGRSFMAMQAWHDPTAMWGRAVTSNPDDTGAWSMYAQALTEDHEPEAAAAAIEEGLTHASGPRLLLHKALAQLDHGDRDGGIATMKLAAQGGEPTAMANYALLVNDLEWARKATTTDYMSVHAWRTLGKLALPTRPEEAKEAFRRALVLEPGNCANNYNLGLAELALDHPDAAVTALEPCATASRLHDEIQRALDDAHRRLRR